jgi:N-methylhydantoinase B
MVTASDGGYGNPTRRGRERALHDLKEEWISRHAAVEIYGIKL